uniref:Hemagglutinin-like secreted protein n=1 Tax=Ganoderma boninense TaxID=34458 RepID=A0A5K1JX99_9APHY|nr:Hemagglutinin-like secreted protein [Ganoderma boninense]
MPDLDGLRLRDVPSHRPDAGTHPAHTTPTAEARVGPSAGSTVHITINATASTVIVNTGSPAAPTPSQPPRAGPHAVRVVPVTVEEEDGDCAPDDELTDAACGEAPVPPAWANHLPWDDAKEFICPARPRSKKWYVVTAGLRVGIWPSWTDAAPMVEGISGNVHESFKSRVAAEHYYYSNKEIGHVFQLAR